ncbi:MAG: prolipoprotein diacylglyceryl transferase [Clostridia bacterium]|nr:prolipoprotein diacylglyceryl transferase [Clostridia bacterium]
MYPYPVFLGLTLYDICLCVGIFICFLLFGYLCDKHKVKRRIQSFAILCGAGAVVLGYCSAVLFQALYNIKSLGRFEINAETGATFYGGLMGGVAVFLALYFGIGWKIFEENAHARAFFAIADSAVPGIALAHSIGRLGCLFAGCCHGAVCDAWYCIPMWGNQGYDKYIPTQLFEAIFLMLLFGYLLNRSLSKTGYCLPIYLFVYAHWRFFIEYLRADYRGDTFVEALTPSQLIACILFAVGIGLIFVEKYLKKRFPFTPEAIEKSAEKKDEENE